MYRKGSLREKKKTRHLLFQGSDFNRITQQKCCTRSIDVLKKIDDGVTVKAVKLIQ